MTSRPALLGLGLCLAQLAGCAPSECQGAEQAPLVRSAPARPDACVEVKTAAELLPALAAARSGAAICLAPGDYTGPLTVPRGVTLWGPPSATIRSPGHGTTVRIEGDAAVLGLSISGSGGRFDTLDAAVHVTGEGGRVEGVSVVSSMFGILLESARGVTVRGNVVRGDAKAPLGLRGDAIRLWSVEESLVELNEVHDGRDIVVWYSSHNTLRGNVIRGGRYGAHFMHSNDNVAENNRYEGVVVGVFVMYSHRIRLSGNTIVSTGGAAGMGLGLKDSGDVTAEGNSIVHATTGLYLDNSPGQSSEHDTFVGNAFRLCQVAVDVQVAAAGNSFTGNLFLGNGEQVTGQRGTDAMDADWNGNYFDDYAGYDLDRDGYGDVPYELRSASGDLVGRHPDLAFFHGSPALAITDAGARLVPVFAPKPMLIDHRPAMEPSAAFKAL